MKIILSGASGLVGSRVYELLSPHYEIISLTSTGGVNITDFENVSSFIGKTSPDYIIHLAAKANVDECEKDKNDDLNRIGSEINTTFDINGYAKDKHREWSGSVSAFGINTIGTSNVVYSAKENNIPILYISTDFVFDGKSEKYSEEDSPNPINWYGMTKYFGEQLVRENLLNSLIVRISYPYGLSPSPKQDFVRKMITFLKEKGELSLIFDQIITPTYIDDVAMGIKFVLEQNVSSNTLHLVGSSSHSPYQIGEILARKMNLKASLSKVKGEDFFRGRAPRPFILKIENDKLDKLGFKARSFEEGVDELIKNI